MGFAIKGIRLLAAEPNARIHAAATIIVCAAGFYFGFTREEWRWIVLSIALVWAAEGFNTAIEFLADALTPNYHPLIEKAKDVAAGAVLITACGTLIIGLSIIGPYLLDLYKR